MAQARSAHDPHATIFPVCALTTIGAWFGKPCHLNIQTELPTWQAEGSSAFAKVPGPNKARAAASDLCGRPPHLS